MLHKVHRYNLCAQLLSSFKSACIIDIYLIFFLIVDVFVCLFIFSQLIQVVNRKTKAVQIQNLLTFCKCSLSKSSYIKQKTVWPYFQTLGRDLKIHVRRVADFKVFVSVVKHCFECLILSTETKTKEKHIIAMFSFG